MHYPYNLQLTEIRDLIADYERQNFSISQCTWDQTSEQTIIAIPPISTTTTTTTSTKILPPHYHPNIATIAGIAVAATTSLAITSLIIYGVAKRKWFFPPRSQSPRYLPELTGSGQLQDQELDSKDSPSKVELRHPRRREHARDQ